MKGDSSLRILLPVTLAAFVTTLDNTVANVALPSIRRDLMLSTAQLEWVVTGYILVFSALLLAGGKLADRYGRSRILTIGLLIFGAGSVLAGLAGNGGVLIAMRAVQGVGGALVMPASLAMIATDIAPRHRHRASALWTASAALALALGPVLGGALTEHAGWSWIFYINVPIVAITLLTLRWSKHHEDLDRTSRIDIAGVVTSGGALALLTWILIDGATHGFKSPLIVAAGVSAGCLLMLFVHIERSSSSPMLAPELFRSRVFNGGNVAQMLWGLALTGMFFFFSLYLQGVLEFSPTEAGATFLPLALLLIAVAPVTAHLVPRIGAHRVGAAGFAIIAIGLLGLGTVGVGGTFGELLPGLLAVGLGSGLTAPLVAEVLSVAPSGMEGLASAVTSAARELSGVLGIAITGVVVVGRENSLLSRGVSSAQAFTDGYQWGLRLAASFMLVAAVVTYWAFRPLFTKQLVTQ